MHRAEKEPLYALGDPRLHGQFFRESVGTRRYWRRTEGLCETSLVIAERIPRLREDVLR